LFSTLTPSGNDLLLFSSPSCLEVSHPLPLYPKPQFPHGLIDEGGRQITPCRTLLTIWPRVRGQLILCLLPVSHVVLLLSIQSFSV
jgi:hypothetical protein